MKLIEAISQASAAAAKRDYQTVAALLEPLRSSPCAPRLLAELGFAYFQLKRYAESAACWGELLEGNAHPKVRGKLQSNLARAAYYAAAAAAAAQDYAQAVRHQGVYCQYYPGDWESGTRLLRLTRIVELQEAAWDLEAARDLIANRRWLDAADALRAVRAKVGGKDS